MEAKTLDAPLVFSPTLASEGQNARHTHRFLAFVCLAGGETLDSPTATHPPFLAPPLVSGGQNARHTHRFLVSLPLFGPPLASVSQNARHTHWFSPTLASEGQNARHTHRFLAFLVLWRPKRSTHPPRPTHHFWAHPWSLEAKTLDTTTVFWSPLFCGGQNARHTHRFSAFSKLWLPNRSRHPPRPTSGLWRPKENARHTHCF